jgi:hypothetical protein
VVEASETPDAGADHVAVYKRLLQEVLDKRPSGTRQRLADALKRNRSFITQIANPSYAIPIPARHVAAIFEICHFSPTERTAFMEAYHKAHPRSLVAVSDRTRGRHVHLVLPDFGSDDQNKAFDALLEKFINGVADVVTATPKTRK